MRNYPVDADRVRMVSTGAVSPVQVWVELSDGSRRPDPSGRQESSADGRPLWRVEVVTPAVEGDERDRTEVITVTVASHVRPEPGPFGQPVFFEGLLVSPGYLSRKTGQLTPPRWTAEGVRGQSRKDAA